MSPVSSGKILEVRLHVPARVPPGEIQSLCVLHFMRRKENAAFPGPPWVGGIHPAINLAIRAAESSRRVNYGFPQDLVESLQEAETNGRRGVGWGSSPASHTWHSLRC